MASEPTTDHTDEATQTIDDDGALQGAEQPRATGETDAAGESDAVAPPARKKAARKRATTSRAARAKAESAEASDEAVQSDLTGDDAPEAEPAAAKRSRTRRPKAASAAPSQEPSETMGEPLRRAEPLPEIDDLPLAGLLPIAESDEDVDEGAEDIEAETRVEAGEAPAGDGAEVPSFGLLFKAPEPVAPRRRRATAAAGAPAPAPERDVSAGREVSDGSAPDTGPSDEGGRGAQTGSDDAADERPTDRGSSDSEDGDGGGRRSRRRGGRGRRPRGGEEEQPSGDKPSDAEADEQSSDVEAPRSSRRGRRGAGSPAGSADSGAAPAPEAGQETDEDTGEDDGAGSRRRRRRRRGAGDGESDERRSARARDEVTALKGSTRLEAKKQRRREGREAGRRRTIITEAEFLARRESVERVMVVRERDAQTQIGVLEDGILVEHYVSRESGASMIGNVYLGRVQNVLPSMEAAFVDIGKGRNAVLYAGEVNWDAAGLEGSVPKRIENALGSGDTVLVQVTKDPIGHKGARLTSQVSLPGRFLVYVPEASMTGISRKLPDTERARLKAILKKVVPDDAGVIVRTAAEGASEEELTADIARLTEAWEKIRTKADKAGKRKGSAGAPTLLHGEPDLTVKVIRDVFNEDFSSLVVSGERAWSEISAYLEDVAPELAKRLSRWTAETDLFTQYRVDEQIAKALDRKVWLPSGGSLVIDRTEAMTVVDVNTGKFVGSGGNLEETVTKNNIEAAEEIVRQLRLRDIGGIIVVDFIDMVLESNRDLVVRRLLECLGRDRTKHQVAEVTSLGLVQMTRKRVGSGLLEVFSEPCAHCAGRGVIVHSDPVDDAPGEDSGAGNGARGRGRGRGNGSGTQSGAGQGGSRQGARGTGGGRGDADVERPQPSGPTAAQIAAAAHAAALKATAATPVDGGTGSEQPESDLVADSPLAPHASAEPEPSAVGEVSVHDEQPDLESAPEVESAPEAESAPEVEAPNVESAPEAESAPEVQAPVAEHAIAAPDAESAADVAETAQSSAAEPAIDEPTALPQPEPAQQRPRRRRGRVVAPAGPPGRSEVRVITADES